MTLPMPTRTSSFLACFASTAWIQLFSTLLRLFEPHAPICHCILHKFSWIHSWLGKSAWKNRPFTPRTLSLSLHSGRCEYEEKKANSSPWHSTKSHRIWSSPWEIWGVIGFATNMLMKSMLNIFFRQIGIKTVLFICKSYIFHDQLDTISPLLLTFIRYSPSFRKRKRVGMTMSSSVFASPDIENDCDEAHVVPGLWSADESR